MNHQNDLIARLIAEQKYLQSGETPREGAIRVANALKDNDEHYHHLKDILVEDRFLPGGRIQSAMGASRQVTPYNCFVSQTIKDSMDGISDAFKESLQTMRFGGGIGYDFSTIRPAGSLISTLDSHSTGPVGDELTRTGFMDIFDTGCSVIRSAGHRRGAQMGVLRVDHPDIRHFIRAKHDKNRLRNFNVSVAVTDEFMEAVKLDGVYDLVFDGKVYSTARARNVWDEIMRSTWEYAEPGVLFIDRINNKNNLRYCETIAATNPCGEQPLPPYGACLLGSFNLVKYVNKDKEFDYNLFKHDIVHVVRAMDNVVDRAIYPLPQQEVEAKTKRRMGLGVTGLANALEIMGFPYGSEASLMATEAIMATLRNTAYRSSISLASEKGAFELFDRDEFILSDFMESMPEDIVEDVYKHGIRNSHLLSVAPTGTISLKAGNVSSGIEPPFMLEYSRGVYLQDGSVQRFHVMDYALAHHGVKSRTSEEISAKEHVAMLNLVSRYVDSSVSKTCNVGPNVGYEDFKDLYMQAYDGGASGCTTYRAGNIDDAPLQALDTTSEKEGAACTFDPETGQRTCE